MVSSPLSLFETTRTLTRKALDFADCPCFEDAIAFLSVMLGSFLSHWFNSHYRPNFTHGFPVGVTPFGLQGTAKTGALIVLNLLKVVIGQST
jgi:hypothetical protein